MAENETAEDVTTDDEWEFSEWPTAEPAAPSGGGLLQDILEAVTAVRAHTAELQAELASVRADLEAWRQASADSLKQIQASLDDAGTLDVGQREALAQVVALTLKPELTALRKEIPLEHMARVASDVRQLRKLLVGPS